MITIDNKEYTKEDLSEQQLAQVQRIQQLRGELGGLEMRASEIQVLIDVYANELKASLTDDDKEEEVIEES
jgi:hypothetical protein